MFCSIFSKKIKISSDKQINIFQDKFENFNKFVNHNEEDPTLNFDFFEGIFELFGGEMREYIDKNDQKCKSNLIKFCQIFMSNILSIRVMFEQQTIGLYRLFIISVVSFWNTLSRLNYK